MEWEEVMRQRVGWRRKRGRERGGEETEGEREASDNDFCCSCHLAFNH